MRQLHANAALIGTNTYGKPVGQIAVDKAACDDRFRIIAFATENSAHQGGYFTGLKGTVEASCQAPDDLAAWLLASQVFGIQRVLSEHNAQQIRAGRSAESVYPEAVERARTAYDLIEKGLAGLEQPGA